MNPRLTMRRHGRKIAVVGALVAVSATTTMALVAGTAAAAPSATQPGKCVDNVNVRSEPSTTSKIVAVCGTGKAVQVAETKDGFVHLTDLKGWAAQEYISVNGKTPPTPASRATRTAPSEPGSETSGRAGTTPGASGDDVDPGRSGDTGASGADSPAPDAGNGTDNGSDDAAFDDQAFNDPALDDQSSDAQDPADQGPSGQVPSGQVPGGQGAASPSPLGGLLG